MQPTVVVTGIGLVTSLGQEIGPFWDRLLRGESGISNVDSFDTSRFAVHLGGEVKAFRPASGTGRCDPAAVGRASRFALSAAAAALRDGGINVDKELGDNWGVCVGTTSGEPQEIEQAVDRQLAGDGDGSWSEFLERYPCHTIASNVAVEFGVGGDVSVIPAACAAGNYAITHAVEALRAARAEYVLAGGADSFSRITYSGFARLGAIARDCCSPFDLNRQGMIPAEGAAILLLERSDTARSRGARVYAEVAGCGLSCDAHHMTGGHPEGAGAVRAMELALADAGIDRRDISYISAHGTGTRSNDLVEALAVKRVFTQAPPPISSIKSMLGHAMGAASAIEAAVCALAVRNDQVPPTVNFRIPDPDCALDCVPNFPRSMSVHVAMNNAYAFGGTNSSVLFRKWKG